MMLRRDMPRGGVLAPHAQRHAPTEGVLPGTAGVCPRCSPPRCHYAFCRDAPGCPHSGQTTRPPKTKNQFSLGKNEILNRETKMRGPV